MMVRTVVVGVGVSALAMVGVVAPAQAVPQDSCWGQASKAFAQTGEMGMHSANQENPRLGIRNLARALHDDGVIPGDSMADLGAFVAGGLGFNIEACQS